MKKNRKSIATLAMIGAVAMLAGSFAWLTHDADVTNLFSTSEKKYEAAIVEKVEGADTESVIKTTNTESVNITLPKQFQPGDAVMKEVAFRNTGNFDELIRIKLTKSGSDAFVCGYTDFLGSEWTKKADGYYYYNYVLAPEETTHKILEEVKFDSSYSETTFNLDFSLKVELETVQANSVAAKAEFGLSAEPTIAEDGSVTWN